MITARFFEILREDQCTCVEGSASVLKDLYLATASAHRGLCSLEKVRYSSTMPPKGADQNKANGISLKKAQQLPTLQPLALGGSSAHHAPLHHEADNSNMDQDPADRLQAGLMDFLGADEDGDGDDQQDFQTLYAVLQNVMKSKQDKKHKKQQAILQELQGAISREVELFEASVAKEQKELSQVVTNAVSGARKKLAEKFKVIEELNVKYQQDMAAAWEGYNDAYTRFSEDTKRKVSAQADRVRSGHKRKLSELQSTLQQQMADAEQKMGKLTAKSGKVEQVGNVFKKFMAAAE